MHSGSDLAEISYALLVERDEPRMARRTDHEEGKHQTQRHDDARGDTEKAVEFHDCVVGASIVFK